MKNEQQIKNEYQRLKSIVVKLTIELKDANKTIHFLKRQLGKAGKNIGDRYDVYFIPDEFLFKD